MHNDADATTADWANEWTCNSTTRDNRDEGAVSHELVVEMTKNAFLKGELRKVIEQQECTARATQIRRQAEETGHSTALSEMEQAYTDISLDYVALKRDSEQREEYFSLQLQHSNNSMCALQDYANVVTKREQAAQAEILMLKEKLAQAEAGSQVQPPGGFSLAFRGKERSSDDMDDVKPTETTEVKSKFDRGVCQAWLRGQCNGKCADLKHPPNLR